MFNHRSLLVIGCGLLLSACLAAAGVLATEEKVRPTGDANVTEPLSAAQPSQLPEQQVAPIQAAHARTGEQIKWQVIGGGGGRGVSTSYILMGTAGQTATGRITSTNFKLNQGFWQNFSGGAGGCCIGLTGNVDCDPSDGADISDLTALIDNLYITFAPLCCDGEANTDGQPGVDISDLTALIDYLYISFTPTAACQ